VTKFKNASCRAPSSATTANGTVFKDASQVMPEPVIELAYLPWGKGIWLREADLHC